MTRPTKILAADLFCGAGGFTTALIRELAAQGIECELVVVNHNPRAIATITKNHPHARAEIADLNHADPEKLVPEGRLDILLASPTCTFHSRARGGKPTSDQERMDPWIIVTWCTKLRVRRLVIENVPEFVDWGPIDPRTGKMIPSRKGEYFRAWIAALEGIGLRIDWQIITAADHGDATTRRRFFLCARNDRKSVLWPEPTHSSDGVESLFAKLKKWRPAREIINWSDRGRSIFARRLSLKPNTLRRIRAGSVKLCGDWAEVFKAVVEQELYRSILQHEACIGALPPKRRKRKKGKKAKRKKPQFIYKGVQYAEGLPTLSFVTRNGRILRKDSPIAGPAPIDAGSPYLILLRGTGTARATSLPLPAITAQGTHLGLVQPFVFQVNQSNGRYRSIRSVDLPLFTVLTRDSYGLAAFDIAPFTCGNRTNNVPRGADLPIPAAVTSGGIFLARPSVFLLAQGSTGAAQRADTDPIPTITTVSRIQLIEPCVAPFVIGQHGGAAPRAATEPLPTIASGGAISLIQPLTLPFVLNRHSDTGNSKARGIEDPFPTITGSGGGYLIEPYLAVLKKASTHALIGAPLPAVTTRRHLAVVEPFIVLVNHGSKGHADNRSRPIEHPLSTVSTHHGFAIVEPFLVITNHGDDRSGNCNRRAQPIDIPLPTVTGSKGFCIASPFLVVMNHGGEGRRHEPEPLNIDRPLLTLTTRAGFAIARPFLTPYYGAAQQRNGWFAQTIDVPLPSVTTKSRFGLVMPQLDVAFLVPNFGERPTQEPRFHLVDYPLPAVTSHGAGGLAQPFVVCTRHSRNGAGPTPRSVDEPLPTITATGHGEFSVVSPTSDASSGKIVYVDGVPVLVDILFRMLRNPELAAAMSFTGEDYSYEFTGTETEITKQIGNAVPVRTARALVRAQLLDLVPARKTTPTTEVRVA